MSNIFNTAMETAILAETGKMLSKVKGNRNWGIRVETTNKCVFVGRYGQLANRGLLREYLAIMVKDGIYWLKYTYKKDFEIAVKVFEENGYKIYWLS